MSTTIIASISAITGSFIFLFIGLGLGIIIGYYIRDSKSEKDINLNVSVPSNSYIGNQQNGNASYIAENEQHTSSSQEQPIVVFKKGLFDDLDSNISNDSESIKKDISSDLQIIKNISSGTETKDSVKRKRNNKNG